MYTYKHAGIAGKFRLLHKAHIELIIRAMGYTENLHVFIVDIPEYKRYASIENLIASFEEVFHNLGFTRYQIHVIEEDLKGRAWDEKLLSLVPHLETMFDSKELYGNILVNNAFIQLNASKEISVTNIEKNLYHKENFYFIAKEFRKYINKKIVVSGTEKSGITTLTRKLGLYYNVTLYTEFNYIIDNLKAMLIKYQNDFPQYLINRIEHISIDNATAKRMLLVNDDIIKLYWKLLQMKDKIYENQLLNTEQFEAILTELKRYFNTFIQDVDCFIYCQATSNDKLADFYIQTIPKEKLKIVKLEEPYKNFDYTIDVIDNLLVIQE